jgi:hypothetical protein
VIAVQLRPGRDQRVSRHAAQAQPDHHADHQTKISVSAATPPKRNPTTTLITNA